MAYLRRTHFEAQLIANEVALALGGEREQPAVSEAALAGRPQEGNGPIAAMGTVVGASGKRYRVVSPDQFLAITGGA